MLISCSGSYQTLGKLNINNSTEIKSFSFAVSDEFMHKDKSKSDKKYPKMTKSEVKLLEYFLKRNNYCINNSGKLLFEVSSRQQAVYDITLADSDINKRQHIRPMTPVTFFGKCL